MTTIRTTDTATWQRLTIIVLRQLVRFLETEGIDIIRTADLAHAVEQLEKRNPT
jgi:hypothetical protein